MSTVEKVFLDKNALRQCVWRIRFVVVVMVGHLSLALLPYKVSLFGRLDGSSFSSTLIEPINLVVVDSATMH